MDFSDPMHWQVTGSPRADVETGIDWSTVVSGGPPAGTAETVAMSLEGVTHRVRVRDLRLRREPTTSDPRPPITLLQPGDELAQLPDAPRDSDGHHWIKVRAVVGEVIKEGWVASSDRFLETVAGTLVAPPPVAPTATTPLEGVTHRVKVRDLRLRREPTTSDPRPPITLLQPGDELAQLPDAPRDSDGHHWIKVRAVVGEEIKEGWVASSDRFLETVD